MVVGVGLRPVRATQLEHRLQGRSLDAGNAAGAAPRTRGRYAVLSGRLSDVRGFNDLLQDFLTQVCYMTQDAANSSAGL